jgi:FdhD protein
MTDRVAVAPIRRMEAGRARADQDLVAVEAPLGIQLRHPRRKRPHSLGLVMRTPGDDRDLVLGLLLAEGVIRSAADVVRISSPAPRRRVASATPTPDRSLNETSDVVQVHLAAHVDLRDVVTGRATMATSACGLCGRLAARGLDALAGHAMRIATPVVSAATISALPAAVRSRQAVFAETGGLHAAALFDAAGHLLQVREDVGRHNAVDKLVGAALAAGWLPARDRLLAVSGRIAFEIVQKTVMAGIPIVVAVGAPSDLAIEAARLANVTLIGFARDDRFNVYTGVQRVEASGA